MRLLLVQAEAVSRNPLAERLTGLGHTVHLAATPEAALDLAGRTELDVALVPLELPGIGGMGLLRMLRDTHPACEVVVLAAQPSSSAAATVLRRGAFSYVRKPCSFEELEAILMKAAAFARLVRENTQLRARLDAGLPADDPGITDNLTERERRHVAAVLRREGGSRVRAAEALGISRRSLYRLIDKHGLKEAALKEVDPRDADSNEEASGMP